MFLLFFKGHFLYFLCYAQTNLKTFVKFDDFALLFQKSEVILLAYNEISFR